MTGEKSLELAVSCGGAGAFNIEFDLKNNTKDKIEKRIAFCQALMCTTSRQIISNMRELAEEPELNEFERSMYPLLPNERVVARYPAKVYDDCCACDCCNYSICCCEAYRCYCCNKKQTCFPGCPQFLTCGRYPTFSEGNQILTTASAITIKQHANNPKGIWRWLQCVYKRVKIDDMDMFVAPIAAYGGTDVTTNLFGHETFWTRLFHKTFCGKNCCPMMRSTIDVSTRVAGVQTSVSNLDMFGSLRQADDVRDYRKASALIQAKLMAIGIKDIKSAAPERVHAHAPRHEQPGVHQASPLHMALPMPGEEVAVAHVEVVNSQPHQGKKTLHF